MNRKQIATAALLAFAGVAAMAQEATPDNWTRVGATQSRDQVRAEVTQAIAAGTLVRGGEATVFADRAVSVKSRDEVRAEARQPAPRGIDVFNVGA
jgi:hypothetical protein